MSLDVYLEGAAPSETGSGIFVREGGQQREITRAEWDARFPGCEPVVAKVERDDLFWANVTHNLGKMAAEAGIYEHLWLPDEIGIERAGELVAPLTDGLARLRAAPEAFKRLNPSNGWGTYEGLIRFVEDYLEACREHPTATVRASR